MSEEFKNISGTWIVNTCVLATAHLSDIKDGLSCILVAVTIGYTLWKWRKSTRKKGTR